MSELATQHLDELDQERSTITSSYEQSRTAMLAKCSPEALSRLNCQQSVLSSVHTQTTTSGIDADGTYAAHRRKLVADEWEQTAYMYASIDAEDGSKKLEQLHSCCNSAWFTRHIETGIVRVASQKCGLRWCPVCASSKASWITKNIQDALPSMAFPKFLTFTLKHSDDSLTDQIARLYRCFNLVRKRKLITKCISGGIWFFQIKKSAKTRQWHPHIHCICSGKYLPHDKLKSLWLAITGDSTIVDIRMIHNHEGAANEVARYAARPSQFKDKSLTDTVEIYRAMHHRRICGTWGKCKSIKLRIEPMPDRDQWINIGGFSTINSLLDIDCRAKDIYEAWTKNKPLAEGITLSMDEVLGQFDHDYNMAEVSGEPPPRYQQHLWSDYSSHL